MLRALVKFSSIAGVLLAGCGEGETGCDPDAPNTICTIAGSGEEGVGGDEGRATRAQLYIPLDTAVSPDGEVWVLDFNNYVVRAIDTDGIIHRVIGNGEVGDGPEAGLAEVPALEARLNHTTDLRFHDGYVYLAGWHNARIKRVRLTDMMLSNVAGRGRRTFYDGDGGPALMASLDLPASIAFDPAGSLVIADQGNQVLRKVDGSGIITTIAGTCVVEDEPCAVGVQPAGCPGSNKLACGDLATECQKMCTPGFGGDGGPARNARVSLGYGVPTAPGGHLTFDRAGNLLFADTDNHRIRKVSTTGVITTIAGTGTRGYAGDGGPATQAQMTDPLDLAVAEDNTIYVTDVYSNCVRKIDPAGIISTVVGQCSDDPLDRGFAGDGGPPLEAKLDRPYGIDLVGTKLYVSDSYNNRIRVVNLP